MSASVPQHMANLRAYGYDAKSTEQDRRKAIDSATAPFGFTVILDRLTMMFEAILEPCVEKSNMIEDINWYKGMLSIYGSSVSARYFKYRIYEQEQVQVQV